MLQKKKIFINKPGIQKEVKRKVSNNANGVNKFEFIFFILKNKESFGERAILSRDRVGSF